MILVVATILRLISFATRYNGPFPWNPNEMSDYRVYAANLIMHHSFSYHWPIPSTYRLPLYPVLLIPFMKHLDLFLFLQTLLSLATILMVWQFTKSQWAVLPLALDLPSIQNASTTLMGDTVFTFLIVLAFLHSWGFVKNSSKQGAFLWSLADMTRTHGFLIPLGIERRWICLAIILFLPTLWIIRNGLLTHQWRLSSSTDYYTVCLAAQITNKPIMKYGQDPFEPINLNELKTARTIILTHPYELAKVIATNSFKFFFATNSEYLLDWLNIPRTTKWNKTKSISGSGTLLLLKEHSWLIWPTAFLTLMYCVYYVLFVAGLFELASDHRWHEFWMLSWTSFCLWFPSILVAGSPHYRVMLMPFICMGASIFMGQWRQIND